MPEDSAPSCHQRPTTWTRGDLVLGVLVWGLVVAVTYTWTQRAAILTWFSTLR